MSQLFWPPPDIGGSVSSCTIINTSFFTTHSRHLWFSVITLYRHAHSSHNGVCKMPSPAVLGLSGHLSRTFFMTRQSAAQFAKYSRDIHGHCQGQPGAKGSLWMYRDATRRLANPLTSIQRRTLLESLHPLLVPPVVFVGLVIALWTWKCAMMVIFQRHIIYMPSMPPFSRSEQIASFEGQCLPVTWREEKGKSFDGTKIVFCIGEIPETYEDASDARSRNKHRPHVVICYFQGNGSSLPPRLPVLSNVLRALNGPYSRNSVRTRYTVVALSYRGYWKSSGRASQSGIELDAEAMLDWIKVKFTDATLVLWGQSIGAGVACSATSRHVHRSSGSPLIAGLVLETPFVSIKRMLFVLYPQKWLPYRYLYPFLWNHWDNRAALETISTARKKPSILVLSATRDEVVPREHADELEALCQRLQLDVKREDVQGALHTEATIRREGIQAVAKFVRKCSVTAQ